ncbi:hypothetical protein ACIPC1_39350 [Streptomyces sp. NPDC087263]|uniref:hypothetical protein n=1 Tax=Streptomyces sp. NPDC087263 TaxID=3365773 RepID=UPI0037F2C793
MDLSGAAAIVATAGIPVSVLIARWQKRTALEQAEATHRTALEVAEATHRTALAVADATHRATLEQAEANHRAALEIADGQAEAERIRRLVAARWTAYDHLRSELTKFRTSLLNGEDQSKLREIYDGIHDANHQIQEVGPLEVVRIGRHIQLKCEDILRQVRGQAMPLQACEEAWKTEISPLRTALHQTIARVMGTHQT